MTFLKSFPIQLVCGLFIIGLAVLGAQWLASIQDGPRTTTGFERIDSTLIVYCGGNQRTLNFVSWPPFTIEGENTSSSKFSNGKLFQVLVGFDGTDTRVSATIGDSSTTLVDCIVNQIIP